jgi:histidyl-tRNA synthetase
LTGSNDEVLANLETLVAGSEVGEGGVYRLREILAGLAAVLPASAVGRARIDASIARGLDYYTGVVLETTLNDLPAIGSICSGGRYDNLAELYTSQQLPGIGASLGLDRLLAAMEELDLLEKALTPAQVFIPYFDAARLGDYFKLAALLRSAGIAVEVYPEPVKLGKQLQYADRKGFRVAVIIGQQEFAAGQCQIKDLTAAESVTVPLADAVAEVQRTLAKPRL